MSGTTATLALITNVDGDSARTIITTDESANMAALDALFHATTGHKHTGAGSNGSKISGADLVTASVPAAALAFLVQRSSYLALGVFMQTAGTYYSGPAVALDAGTWLVWGVASIDSNGQAAGTCIIDLFDGTAEQSTSRFTVANVKSQGSIVDVITTAVAITCSLRVSSLAVGGYSLDAFTTHIVALRVV